MAALFDQDILAGSRRLAVPAAGVLTRLSWDIARRWQGLQRWRDRTAAVRQLTRLDDHLLQDIGLSRHEIAPSVEAWQAQGEAAARWPD